MTYTVHQARGPLYQRQMDANKAGVAAYVEQHLNATTDRGANYAMVITVPNANRVTLAWGRTYTALISKEFGHKNLGCISGGRGTFNLKFLKCPALLLEPGFVSNPGFAAIAKSGEGQDALARCLVESIKQHFDGGLIGLSVGHMYRGTGDRGAPVYEPDGYEDAAWDDEAEICDAVINAATEMLVRA
jgi:hypothetical protein